MKIIELSDYMTNRILFVLLLLPLFSGCNNSPAPPPYEKPKNFEIDMQELHKYTPENYEIYSVNYEDLDKDGLTEALVFYKQDRNYRPDIEILELPAKVRVFDYQFEQWKPSQLLDTAPNAEAKAQILESSQFDNLPLYRIKKNDGTDTLVVFSYAQNFDWLVAYVGIFSYDDKFGLNSNYNVNMFSANAAIVEKGDVIYFVSADCCVYEDCTFDENVSLAKLDLQKLGLPEQIRIERPTCDDLAKEAQSDLYFYDFPSSKFEGILEKYGVNLN